MNKNILKKWWFILLLVIVYTIIIIGFTYMIISNNVEEKTIEAGVSQLNQITKEDNKNEEKKEQIKEVALNEKIIEKDWEVTIKEVGFKQDITPSNPNSYYMHYQVKDTSNTYFYVIVDAKNISSLSLKADNVAKIKMKYDDKYEYATSSAIEESGGGTFTYTNITSIDPLTTRKLYYLVEVPKAIEDEGKAVNAEITINDNIYLLKIR